MIAAPYNFVPLNDKVFYPSWADKISHDIPFEDGESGVIELEITAQSPIFIRNHYAGEKGFYETKVNGSDKKISTEFCHFINETGDKEFYIPAASIKGMIRNVLEIMGFSKIRIDEEKHKKYLSVRDMTNRSILAGIADGCGFLVKQGDDYIIFDCGKIITLDLQKEKGYEDIKSHPYGRDKYEKFGFLKEIKFSQHQNQKNKFITRGSLAGDQKGFLVFTGNIDNKKHEFIFSENGKKIQLNKHVFKNFEKVYFKNQNSIDGQFWKDKFEKGSRIPIFYKKEKNKNNIGKMQTSDKIIAVGLTQIFKIAYNKTIFEAAKQSQAIENGVDLSDAIFGFVKKDKALKGRVYFSHFKSTNTGFEKEQESVFGSPKESYYPNYLEQHGKDGVVYQYKTLMDKDAKIRGYKRYPLHKDFENEKLPDLNQGNDENQDIKTKFIPLSKGVTFKGKVVFHNLKKVEIGALLSAITFHGEKSKVHNIGFAKPYGYGKISIGTSLVGLKFSRDQYIKEFEKEMNEFHPNWRESHQIQELFAMADSTKCKDNSALRYQKLDPNSKENEFVADKKSKYFLMSHSEYVTIDKASKSDAKENKGDKIKSNSKHQNYKNFNKKTENKSFGNRIDFDDLKKSKK